MNFNGPYKKSPFGFSLWVITCVSIGFTLAYASGVDVQAIVKTAVIIASGVTASLFAAWALKTAKK